MSDCNCEKQDGYANCCKLAAARAEVERVDKVNRDISAASMQKSQDILKMTAERDALRAEVAALKAKFNSAKNVGCDATCLNYSDTETVAEVERMRAVVSAARNLKSLRGRYGTHDFIKGYSVLCLEVDILSALDAARKGEG